MAEKSPYVQPFMENVLKSGHDNALMTDEEMATLTKWKPQASEPNKGRFPQAEVENPDSPQPVLNTSEHTPDKAPTDPDDFVVKPEWTADDPAPTGRSKKSTADMTPVQVGRVLDGDTFVARIDGQDKTIRISGIDAPELGPGGQGAQSREALSKLLARGDVKISVVGQDNYGRPVAKVTVGGVDAGSWMKQGGFATAWMGQPEGWPHGNELRTIRRDMPIEDKVRFADLETWYRKFGLMARSGRRPTPEQIAAAEKEARYFMDKYVNPQGKRVQQGGLDPETERAMGIIPSNPADRGPMGRPVTEPEKWEDVSANANRPQGKREWSAWEHTLHPQELALWRKFQATDKYYTEHAPHVNRAKYFSAPEYVRFRKLYEKFLDLTTKRYRNMPPPAPSQGGRRHRRKRADLEGDAMEALEAVA